MATTVKLRKLLDRKTGEMMTPSPVTNGAGMFVISDSSGDDKSALYVTSASAVYRYDHLQDGYQLLPASGIAGTFGAGSCGCFHNQGPSGTATAGTTTTITTNLTIPRTAAGYKIRILSGPNAGVDKTILSNTYGANSVLTVDSAYSTAITSASTYVIYSGRFWFMNAGAGTVGFAYYDRLLNTWTARSVTNLPTTWGTDARLVGTPSERAIFASGTATSATATTLVNSAKTWTANQWTNYQVRITGGTGAGQIRTIASNTNTTLTVATWTTNPDATSTYVIEGNDDNLYLLGNNAVTMYKYSISGNTWSTLSPTVARGGAFAVGGGANWVSEVTSSNWNNESNFLNGKYIYSFRGGGSSTLDLYDISANSWVNAQAYGQQGETFNTGSCCDVDGDNLYIIKENTGRIFRFILAENRMIPFTTLLYPQGTATVGDKLWVKNYVDGATSIKWVYSLVPTSTALMRCMMIDS